eukprot:CAMPEP_0177630112 /NCGR_PEP_ID=MMETSP0447-20121125/1035_1 /TAXON_ID=0 /ORGANISM="Stygamoeba regulata, Strain BSH-02190019" /LENGTH=177 /DNA_ID=CAMNT_0019131493 /DNA_START=84 /DNA_END=617 /DNA_ORIENTATION=+
MPTKGIRQATLESVFSRFLSSTLAKMTFGEFVCALNVDLGQHHAYFYELHRQTLDNIKKHATDEFHEICAEMGVPAKLLAIDKSAAYSEMGALAAPTSEGDSADILGKEVLNLKKRKRDELADALEALDAENRRLEASIKSSLGDLKRSYDALDASAGKLAETSSKARSAKKFRLNR